VVAFSSVPTDLDPLPPLLWLVEEVGIVNCVLRFLHIRTQYKVVRGSWLFSGPTSQSTGGSSVFIDFGHCLQ
jgi:hypothetical protein